MVVDQILIKLDTGQARIGLNDWQAMEVEERIELINLDAVQFLAEGQAVGVREALLSIKASYR